FHQRLLAYFQTIRHRAILLQFVVPANGNPGRFKQGGLDHLELPLDRGIHAEDGRAGGAADGIGQVFQFLEYLDGDEVDAIVGGGDEHDGPMADGLEVGQQPLVEVGTTRLPGLLDAGGDGRKGFNTALVTAGIGDLEEVVDHVENLLEHLGVGHRALGNVDGV